MERFLVHKSLCEKFIAMMQPRVAQLQLGDVLAPDAASRQIDVGAMVTDRLFGRLEELIAQAETLGARCLVGGKRAADLDGHYFQPTLLVDV